MEHHQPYACDQQAPHELPSLHNHLRSSSDPAQIIILMQLETLSQENAMAMKTILMP